MRDIADIERASVETFTPLDQPASVASINRLLAHIYGKRQFILTAGAGYYYFRGEHERAYQPASIYIYRVSHTTLRDMIEDAVSNIEKVIS